jgi:mannose-6-phosphate isomerase-like protein (cupin superfamily)
MSKLQGTEPQQSVIGAGSQPTAGRRKPMDERVRTSLLPPQCSAGRSTSAELLVVEPRAERSAQRTPPQPHGGLPPLVTRMGSGQRGRWPRGRSSTLKLRNGETDESVMIFEEVALVGSVTSMHLHHDSDEVAYVLSGEITFQGWRRGHGRRAGRLRVHAAPCCPCLEEHRCGDRPRAVHVHARKGRKAVRGDGGTASGFDGRGGVRRGCPTARLKLTVVGVTRPRSPTMYEEGTS